MMADNEELVERRPRYHVEGQTSTKGPRWLIWDGVEGHFARYQNIADEGDAAALCAKLNADATRIEQLHKEVEKAFTAGFDAACRHYLLPTGPNNRGILEHELEQFRALTGEPSLPGGLS